MHPDPTRPLYVRTNGLTDCSICLFRPNATCRIQNPDIQRAGRVGAHGGAARRGRAEHFAQETSVPRAPKASKTRLLNISPEARRSKILCKPMEEQNPRLTTGSKPVHLRFITGTRSALFFTFNVKLVNGDFDAGVDKLGEVHKKSGK